MKKSLIALAALAAVTAASAQSTVTLSGTYALSYQGDLTSDTRSSAGVLTKSQGFAVTSNDFKLTAVEDLGGGLKASADMTAETGFTRASNFTRADSGISVSGGFGTVAFRSTRNGDQLSGIMSSAVVIPDSVYDATGILARAEVETLSYTSNELIPGVRASLTYVEPTAMAGNVIQPTSNSQSYVVGATYANGPLSLGVSFKTAPNSVAASNGLTAKSNTEIAASYNFGVATISYAFDGKTSEGASTAAATTGSATATALSAAQAQEIANLATKDAHGISVTVPVGAFSLGFNYAKRGDAKYTAFGATYALSKRTSISAASGQKTGLALADEATGYTGNQYRIRLAHSF